MALTQEERRELHRIEKAARDLRAKKNAEVKAKGRVQRRERSKAVDRSRPEQRKERDHDAVYLQRLRRARCCVGAITGDACDGRTDPAHIRFSDFAAGRVNPGKGRKPDDRWCLPICRKHHEAQHAHGNERRFWSDIVGADSTDLARAYYAAHEADEDFEPVLRRFIPTRPE